MMIVFLRTVEQRGNNNHIGIVQAVSLSSNSLMIMGWILTIYQINISQFLGILTSIVVTNIILTVMGRISMSTIRCCSIKALSTRLSVSIQKSNIRSRGNIHNCIHINITEKHSHHNQSNNFYNQSRLSRNRCCQNNSEYNREISHSIPKHTVRTSGR
jgi:hypothetical protein